MRCLYCGKELALFKRLRGGEFCSDAHRQRYQEEYTQLALNRLLQANSQDSKDSKEKDANVPAKATASQNGKEARPEVSRREEPIESPAIKRRERLKSDEAPLAPAAHFGGTPTLVKEQVFTEDAEAVSQEIALLDRETAHVSEPVEEEPASIAEPEPAEPPLPAMAGLLVELPLPTLAGVAEMSSPQTDFSTTRETLLPQAQGISAETGREIALAAGVDSRLPDMVDWSVTRQRVLEVREFVRSVPVMETILKPVGDTDLPRAEEPFEVSFEPYPVESAAALWHESGLEFAASIVALQEMTLEPTEWGETAVREETEAEEDGPAQAAPEQVMRLAPKQPLPTQNLPAVESTRVEPARVDPLHFESARPQAFHFEPVQVDRTFINPGGAQPEVAAESIDAPADAARTDAAPAEPSAAPVPEAITLPEPVTLHGIAPPRGKLTPLFASVLPRAVEIEAPRLSSLPLRPVMVFGPAAPGPAAPPAAEAKAAPEKSARPSSVPEKQDPRAAGTKRKSEVRVIALPVKAAAKAAEARLTETRLSQPFSLPARPAAEAKSAEAKTGAAKVADTKPAPAKPSEPAPKKEEVRKPVPAAPAAALPAKASQPAAKKEDLRKPTDAVPDAPVPAKDSRPADAPASDLLGLPTLSLESSGSFWSRIPMMMRIGIIAAVLAAAIGGIVLTSHGSGSTSTSNAKPTPNRPTVVEAGPALATNAGWVQDWFTDPRGSKLSRHVDVLRGSLALRDYRLEMEGQIDQGAIGWVFRANNKSFYAEKVAIVTPGLEPTIALVRIAVVDGKEVSREQVPLPLKVHLDTLYKIRVDAVGHRFTTWVQDQQVDEWNDSRIEAGGVGLYYDGGESAHLKGTLNVIPLKEK